MPKVNSTKHVFRHELRRNSTHRPKTPNFSDKYNFLKEILISKKETLKIKGIPNFSLWKSKEKTSRPAPERPPMPSKSTQRPDKYEEEENCFENERELRNIFYEVVEFKKDIKLGKILLESDMDKKPQFDRERCSQPKLSSLININCMMNVDVKQSQPIWQTNFGKRLLKEKNLENVESYAENTCEIDELKKDKFTKESFTKRSSIHYAGGTGSQYKKLTSPRSSKGKASGLGKENKLPKKELPNNMRKANPKSKLNQNPSLNIHPELIDTQTRILSKHSRLFALPTIEEENDHLGQLNSPPSKKNQNFLSKCVRNILEGVSPQIICNHCGGTFNVIQDIVRQKNKQFEDKPYRNVYYNRNDYVKPTYTNKCSYKLRRNYFSNLQNNKGRTKKFQLTSKNIALGLMNLNKKLK